MTFRVISFSRVVGKKKPVTSHPTSSSIKNDKGKITQISVVDDSVIYAYVKTVFV